MIQTIGQDNKYISLDPLWYIELWRAINRQYLYHDADCPFVVHCVGDLTDGRTMHYGIVQWREKWSKSLNINHIYINIRDRSSQKISFGLSESASSSEVRQYKRTDETWYI